MKCLWKERDNWQGNLSQKLMYHFLFVFRPWAMLIAQEYWYLSLTPFIFSCIEIHSSECRLLPFHCPPCTWWEEKLQGAKESRGIGLILFIPCLWSFLIRLLPEGKLNDYFKNLVHYILQMSQNKFKIPYNPNLRFQMYITIYIWQLASQYA